MISRRIGRYEIDRLLGEGGVGRVYAARDTLLSRQVAIKILRPEASRNREFVDRFVNEAKSFGDLRHPNIAMLYDLDLESQQPHMVMELIEGHTLEELLEWGAMPARECLAVIAQASVGLAVAHRKGVIHRDIKPANLMVTEGGLLKIMDFGIARVRGSQRLTRTNQVFATLLYASPEQLRSAEVDERSDIYSLAAVAYELLAGRPPFSADNDAELRTAQLEMQPPPLSPLVPGLSRRVEAGILRALAKRPKDRFATVEEFADVIGASALRRDAPDILRAYFEPIRRRTSERREIRHSVTPDLLTPPLRARSSASPIRNPRTDDHLVSPGAKPSASLRRPLAVLSTVVLVLIAGIGYAVWSSEKFVHQPTRILESAGPKLAPATPPKELFHPERPKQEESPPSSPPAVPYAPPPNPSPFREPAPRAVPLNPPAVAPPKAENPQSPTIPNQKGVLLGSWTGTWNNSSRLRGLLIIKQIYEDGRVDLEYRYGQGSPSTLVLTHGGRFNGNDIISFLDDQGSMFEFNRVENDLLEARYSSRTGELRARFTRQN